MADTNPAGETAAPLGGEDASASNPQAELNTEAVDAVADTSAGEQAEEGQERQQPSDAGEGDGAEPDPKPKREGGFQRRIRQLEAREQALLEHILKGGSAATAPGASQTPQTTQDDQAPDPRDTAKYPLGNHDPDYIKDAAKFEVRQEIRKADDERRAGERQRELAGKTKAFRDRAQEVAKAYEPGFMDAVEALLDPDTDDPVPISPPMAFTILEMDRGPEVAVYLDRHRDEAAHIYRMPPHLAAAQLGRIEAKLPERPARRQTAAPAPPKEVRGGQSKVDTYDPSKDSADDDAAMERYKAWRAKQG